MITIHQGKNDKMLVEIGPGVDIKASADSNHGGWLEGPRTELETLSNAITRALGRKQ
jgi:hypothetical protein